MNGNPDKVREKMERTGPQGKDGERAQCYDRVVIGDQGGALE